MRAPRALALAVILAASACTPPVVRATPTPEPTPRPTERPTVAPATVAPTVAPTPTPPPRTAEPTAPRTPRPRPTTRTAGEQLLPYYFAARQLFPLLPSAPEIDLDEPADAEGDAWYRGLTPFGIPRFAVREDFVMTARTANHEIGHAYEDLLRRRFPDVDVRARYWAFRGFPGTWQEAARMAASQPGAAQWIMLPGESWAEAFSIAVVGSGQEKTLDYGRTIDPVATRAFFRALAGP
ncbi:MAG TPA: hypothetical protein VFM93_04255 [Candidatus Limnocylindria bacterium]|nr:hypothetical protein [Candidatus Limnocylindria bacterium]